MAPSRRRAVDRPDLANRWSVGDDPGCIRTVMSELHAVESSDFRRAQLRVHPCSFSGAELQDVGAVAHSGGKGCPDDHKKRRDSGPWRRRGVHRGPATRPVPYHACPCAASMPVLHLCTPLCRLLGPLWLCSSLHLGSRHLRPLHSPAGRGFRSRARPAASGPPVCPSSSSDFRASFSHRYMFHVAFHAACVH